MTTTNALQTVSPERAQLLATLPPDGRALALEVANRLGCLATGHVMVGFDVGRLIAAGADEDRFGLDLVEKLAAFCCRDARELHALARFAAAFPGDPGREYVAHWSSRRSPQGHSLSISHWLALSRVTRTADREKLLERAIAEDLSVAALGSLIDGGAASDPAEDRPRGRRSPSRPVSPQAGLAKFRRLMADLVKYAALMDDVFAELMTMPPERVNDMLLRVTREIREQVLTLKATLAQAVDRLAALDMHFQTVLDLRAAKAAAAAEPEAAGLRLATKRRA